MQPFSLGVTTRGVTGAERGPHLAASVGLHGREMELRKAAAQHVRNANDMDKIFRKAVADQRGDPLKMVAVSKFLSVYVFVDVLKLF